MILVKWYFDIFRKKKIWIEISQNGLNVLVGKKTILGQYIILTIKRIRFHIIIPIGVFSSPEKAADGAVTGM